jgi:hypothetical protein
VPLHMAFCCHYMVVVGVGNGIWRPLSVDTTSEIVVKRMATSRMYSANGVLPSSTGIPQPHVRVVVFRTILGRQIYDRLTSMHHLRGSVENSYINVDCASDTWSSMFSPILHLSVMKHHKNHIRFTITGYELFQEHIFFAWSAFSERDIAVETEDDPHPPRSRVDPTMTFSFYGHSVKKSHLCVSFTWNRYQWDDVLCRYKGISAALA